MDKHERTMRISSVDENGVFEMTLATEGEASDGDILSIEGGVIPNRMPLLLSHWNDPTAIAGSVTNPRKELKAKPPQLRSTGQIEMGGVGTLADIRRDVAFMTAKHGGAVSIRWDVLEGGKPPLRRVNLPSDHPHFVDAETEKDQRKLWGMFWPSWKALEGSIVALGADPSATVDGRIYAARAEETDGEVSAFWRALAADAEGGVAEMYFRVSHETEEEKQSIRDSVSISEKGLADLQKLEDREIADEPTYEPVHLEPKAMPVAEAGSGGTLVEDMDGHDECIRQHINAASDALSELQRIGKIARDLDASPAELFNAVHLDSDGDDEKFEIVTIGDEEVFLPQRLADKLAEERARAETPAQEPEPDPEPAPAREDHPSPQPADRPSFVAQFDASAFGRLLENSLEEFEARMTRNVESLLDSRTGKVRPK